MIGNQWIFKESGPMVISSIKDRLFGYFLIVLIICFFMIPVVTFCFFECKFFVPKTIASVLLFFFR